MRLPRSIGFHDILLFALLLLLLILLSLDFSESNPDVQFLSRGQSFVRYAGQSVEMDCEFYAVALDMFQHHIIWYKSQRLRQQQHQQLYKTDEGGWGGGGGGGETREGEGRWEGEGRRSSEGWIGDGWREREGWWQWGGWTEEGGLSARGGMGGGRDRRRGGDGGKEGGGSREGERWVREGEEEEKEEEGGRSARGGIGGGRERRRGGDGGKEGGGSREGERWVREGEEEEKEEEGGRSARGGIGGGRGGRRGRGGGKEGGAREGERWVREEEEEEEEGVWSDGVDRMQVNLMGSLLDPFASTGRYRVSLSQQPPTYRLRLLLTVEFFAVDLTAADTGIFSCHVHSVNDAEATEAMSITHALHVRAPVDTIHLTDDHSTLFNLSNFFETSFGADGLYPTDRGTITVTDGRLNTVGCVVIGGYPPPAVDIYDGQREVTKQFALLRVFRYEGPRGLKTVRYLSARWSQQFVATEDDNGKVVKCEATVDGLTPHTTSAKLNVHFVPVVSCRGVFALVGERNVFVSCQVRSNPRVSNVVWTFEDNGTSVISSRDTASDQYWTVVKTQLADFRLEVRLYIRQVRREHFRCYKVTTENVLGRTSASVQLMLRSRPVDRTTNPISFDARIKARKDEMSPTVRRSQPLHVDSSNDALQTKGPLLFSLLFPVMLLLPLASLTTRLQTRSSV